MLSLIGYLGSALVIVSLSMSNIRRLRLMNLCGAGLVAIFAFGTQSWPVAILNSVIVCLNVFHLIKISYAKDYFSIITTMTPDSQFVQNFLAYYLTDIAEFFPEFDLKAIKEPRIVLISRNLNPVGLFISSYNLEQGIIDIHLDYARPEFRDFKSTRYYLSHHVQCLKDLGLHTLRAKSNVPAHYNYLLKMGFKEDPKNPHCYLRAL